MTKTDMCHIMNNTTMQELNFYTMKRNMDFHSYNFMLWTNFHEMIMTQKQSSSPKRATTSLAAATRERK